MEKKAGEAKTVQRKILQEQRVGSRDRSDRKRREETLDREVKIKFWTEQLEFD